MEALNPQDLALTKLEIMLIEALVNEDEVATRGLMTAYELHLKERYPGKV